MHILPIKGLLIMIDAFNIRYIDVDTLKCVYLHIYL